MRSSSDCVHNELTHCPKGPNCIVCSKSKMTKRLDNNSNCDSPRTFAERVSSMGIIKMNDYLKGAGNRQQYFKEGFVNDILVVSHKEMFLTI